MRDQRLVERVKQKHDGDKRLHEESIARVRVEIVVRLQARHTVQSTEIDALGLRRTIGS